MNPLLASTQPGPDQYRIEALPFTIAPGGARFLFRPLSWLHKVSAALIGAVVVLYVASCLLTSGYRGGAFFALPIVVGFIAGMFYPKSPFMTSLYAILIALGLSLVGLQTGVIYVLFWLPILLPMLWLGAFVGSVVVRHLHERFGGSSTIARSE